MSTHLYARFSVRPELRDEFVALLHDLLPETRSFTGCRSADVFVTADEPTGVVLFEEWSSRDEHGAYMRWRMDTGLGDRLGPFMTDGPAFTFLESSRR